MKHIKNNGYLFGFETELAGHRIGWVHYPCTLDKVSEVIGTKSLCSLNQIHSSIVVHSNPSLEQEADAHYTENANEALVVKTADCLPILLVSKSENIKCACHAGWRGLSKGIVEKSIEVFKQPNDLVLFIGPHIFQEHFEVGNDVADEISESIGSREILINHPSDTGKKLVDLALGAKLVALGLGVQESNILNSRVNTFSNRDYPSFRRDKSKGRIYSFVI